MPFIKTHNTADNARAGQKLVVYIILTRPKVDTTERLTTPEKRNPKV